MTATEILAGKINIILQDARLAPSVHNTQPWQVRINANVLEIIADEHHTLSEGDPTGRQTAISIGIFAEAIILTASQHCLESSSIDVKNGIVSITFVTVPTPEEPATLVEALRHRCSDRSIYQNIAIDSAQLESLRTSYTAQGIQTYAVTDEQIIEKVALLTSRAIGVALSSPGFRYELSQFLVLPWSMKKRGISVKSLHIPWPQTVTEPLLLKLGIGVASEAKLEYKRWISASGLIIITADGDMPKYWFEAGRTYLRASLAAELLGFSQATSAAIVEASNYHEDIEQLLGTNKRILAVIRIGKGSAAKQYSPRIDPQEILTST